jgi:alcohol dehydrogenase YqhD (iron-dependent ADH family)
MLLELKDLIYKVFMIIYLRNKVSKLNKEKIRIMRKILYLSLSKNVKNNTIKDRFIEVLDNLKKHDYKITEFLVLTFAMPIVHVFLYL